MVERFMDIERVTTITRCFIMSCNVAILNVLTPLVFSIKQYCKRKKRNITIFTSFTYDVKMCHNNVKEQLSSLTCQANTINTFYNYISNLLDILVGFVLLFHLLFKLECIDTKLTLLLMTY